MIAANVAAAKALESKASPVVYRVHEPPTREKLIALKDYFKSHRQEPRARPGHHPEPVQPHDQGHRRRGREGAGHGGGAAQPDPGLLRAAERRATSASRSAATRTSPRRSGAMPTCWCTARWSMRSTSSSPHPKGKLPAEERPVRPRPRRPVQGHRSDQPDRAPRDGSRARHHRPLRRRLALGPRRRDLHDPHHRGAELRLLRHHRRPRRRRAGAGLLARARVLPLRRRRAGAGRREHRHALRGRRHARAASSARPTR